MKTDNTNICNDQNKLLNQVTYFEWMHATFVLM